jgi:hypothetical protein
MNILLRYITRVYNSPRLLVVHVLFIGCILFLQLESDHESALFRNIVRTVRNQTQGQHDTVCLRQLMAAINTMMQDRNRIFKGSEQLSYKARLFKSVDADLMYGAGACGGFSKVLSRAIKTAGFTTRIGQMKVNGNYGGHILLETYLPSLGKWVVMDPLYQLTFTNPGGHWASFSEVSADFARYRAQIPATLHYNFSYDYAGIRYTNWSKVPLLGALAYQGLQLLKGKDYAEQFSARPFLLDHYRLYKWGLILLYGLNISIGMVLLYKKSNA